MAAFRRSGPYQTRLFMIVALMVGRNYLEKSHCKFNEFGTAFLKKIGYCWWILSFYWVQDRSLNRFQTHNNSKLTCICTNWQFDKELVNTMKFFSILKKILEKLLEIAKTFGSKTQVQNILSRENLNFWKFFIFQQIHHF